MSYNNYDPSQGGHNQYPNQYPQQQQHVFQQTAAYGGQQNVNYAQAPYGYPNNQNYPPQGNYSNQYPQDNQYYGEQEDDYEQEDFDNLAEIEREMNKSTSLNNFGEEDKIVAEFEKDIEAKSSRSFLPAGATPSGANGVLSPHAAEFWFPECRNCECCKGFKHGCACCKNGVDTCTSASCIDNEFKQQVSTELASRTDTTPVKSSGSASSYKVENPRSAPAATTGGDICKFETAPGGCRFGASCRFKHNFPPVATSSTPATSGVPGAAAQSPCIYFQRGNCQFGNACRFSHN